MATTIDVPALSRTPMQGARAWQQRKIGLAKRRIRRTVIPRERRYASVRYRLARQHLHGTGLEIGALHLPLTVPRNVSVRYVDRLPVPELRRHYPELDIYDLIEPDIVDDGETLSSVPGDSVDFVIANHMIEHCEDPIGTIKSWLRVIRRHGVIYMAVPDCRFTFDRRRPVTPLSHLCRDHTEGPQWSRRKHYEEWAHFVDRVRPSDVASRADELVQAGYSIHFHVWTPSDFLDLLTACRNQLALPLAVEAVERNEHEFIAVLSRTDP